MKGLEEKYAITGVDIVKTHDLDSFIIIVGRGKISGMIGREGRNIRLMSAEFKKKIRIIKEGDVRQMVADLVSPAKIEGVNVLYTNEGERFKVIIPSAERRKIYMDEKALNAAVEAIFKGEVIIKYQ
jgi:transcription antitermination factor NusA-like protein